MTLQPMHSRSKNGTPLYEKKCRDCGKITLVDKRKLGMRCAKCAGIAKRTHGLSVGGILHPAYKLWASVKARCESPNASNYKYYGARGIKMCEGWRHNPKSFVDWAIANGWQKGLDIDRINNDGEYSPHNCRFTSHLENSQKTRRVKTSIQQAATVKKLLQEGVPVVEAAREAGISYMSAWHIAKNNSWHNAALELVP